MPDAPRPATPSLPRLRLRLRTVMIGVFSAGVIGLAGALAWFTSQRSSAAAVEMAGEIILQVGDRVDLETRLLLQPLHFLCDHVPTLPGARNKPGGLDHPLLALFLDVLSETPQAYSLYLGYDDGDFLQAISLLDRPEAAAQLHVPPGTVFCLRRILHRGATRLEQWRYLDAGRRVLLASPPASAVYDPRTRPWYDPGRTAGHVARSPLYIFSSSREMGLTLSSPVPGPVPGVFGADMSLSSLSRFLGTAGVRQAGTVFLFETGGGLVAHPTPGVVARMQPGPRGAPELVRGTTASLDDPRVRAVARAFEAAGRTEVPLRREVLDGRAFLIQVRPAADLGDGCFLGLASPEDAFTGPMIRTRDQSLIFAAVLLLTGVPLLGMVASRLAAQVRRLTEEAERIRRLELDSDSVVDSGIDEVARLGRAVADMRSALRTF
ncbi:MAG: cache and HAMP domain-containing protein, partial [Desulfovibrionaceae bacterium]